MAGISLRYLWQKGGEIVAIAEKIRLPSRYCGGVAGNGSPEDPARSLRFLAETV